MLGFNGGLIGKTRTTSSLVSVPGVWTPSEQIRARSSTPPAWPKSPLDLWTPQFVTTALWLDAADETTVTVADGAVSEWRDKSSSARHFSQGTASARPVYTTAGGYKVIRFDGVNDHLTIAQSFFPSAVASQNFTVLAVVRSNAAGFFGGVITTNQSGDNAGFAIISNGTQGNFQIFPGSATANAGTNRALITAVLTSTPNQRMWLNGSLAQTTTVSQVLNHASITELGKYRTTENINFGNLDIEEIVVLFNDTTDATRQLLEGYAAHKLGLVGSLPVGHPYKSAPP